MHLDRADIKQTEAIKFSKICNISSALLGPHPTFIDTMNALVSYPEVFHSQYRFKFVNACINDIVNETLSSEYLPQDASDLCTICTAGSAVYKRQYIGPSEGLRTERKTGENMAMLHSDCSALYSSDLDKVKLKVGSAEYFIVNPPSALFRAPSFYSDAKYTLVERGKVYLAFTSKVHPSLL